MRARWWLAVSLGLVSCTMGRPGADPSPSPPPRDAAVSSPSVVGTSVRVTIRSAPYRLIAPIQRAVAVWDGPIVYIIGGLDAANTTVGGVYSMNPVSGRLTAVGSLAQPVHDAAVSLISGRIFVFGGGTGSGTDTVQSFDPRTGRAAVVGHLPVALSDLAAARIGATTYIVGGFDGSNPRREIYATTDGRSFSVVGHLPVGLR